MVERDRSEELAKRMTKSLKSRAAEAMSAAADGEGDGALPKAAANGSALGSENGDEVRTQHTVPPAMHVLRVSYELNNLEIGNARPWLA